MGKTKDGKLTVKQENYAQLLVKYGNGTQAYREAYNTENCTDATCSRKSSELLENPKVLARVEELRKKTEVKHAISRDKIIKRLISIADDYDRFKAYAETIDISDHDMKSAARMLSEFAKASDAKSALVEIAKILGYYKPEKQEIDHSITINIQKPD